MENVFFDIRQEDFSDKALSREFGTLILRSRETWRRVIEPLLILMLWYCALKLLALALTPVDGIDFLSQAVMWIGLGIFLLAVGVALWVTVYILCFRAAAVGRKRLQKLDGWGRCRFEEARMISETETGSVEAPYEDFAQIIDEIYEGKQAFYFKLIGVNLYMVVQKKCFIIGKPEDFCRFIREKTGKPVKYIK